MKNLLGSLFTYNYPDDTPWLFLLSANRDMIGVFNNWDNLRGGRMEREDWEFERLLTDLGRDYLHDSSSQGLRPGKDTLVARNFEVWYSVTIPIENQIPTEEEIAKAVEVKSRPCPEAPEYGVRPVVANHEMWLRRMQVMLNPGKGNRLGQGRVPSQTEYPPASSGAATGPHGHRGQPRDRTAGRPQPTG